MDPLAFKERVTAILGEHVEFLGPDFDKVVRSLPDSLLEEILEWLRSLEARTTRPVPLGGGGRYRDIPLHELLSFVRRLRHDRIEYRVLVVKVKNRHYIEFHLGKHDYYDTVRRRLRLR